MRNGAETPANATLPIRRYGGPRRATYLSRHDGFREVGTPALAAALPSGGPRSPSRPRSLMLIALAAVRGLDSPEITRAASRVRPLCSAAAGVYLQARTNTAETLETQ